MRDVFSLSRLRAGQPLQLVSRTPRHTSVAITDKYYNDYILNDLVETVNDSPLIREALVPEELVQKGIKLFKKTIGKDERIFIEESRDIKGNTFLRIIII